MDSLFVYGKNEGQKCSHNASVPTSAATDGVSEAKLQEVAVADVAVAFSIPPQTQYAAILRRWCPKDVECTKSRLLDVGQKVMHIPFNKRDYFHSVRSIVWMVSFYLFSAI